MADDQQAVQGEQAQRQPSPAWYDNPEGPGLRYWDGEVWTDSYHPGPEKAGGVSNHELLWGLALGFGAAGGVVGLLSIPVMAFYWPLGFGVAGLALAIAAYSTRNGAKPPWYGWVAVAGSLLALVLGISAYSEFMDTQSGLSDVERDLDELLRP